ncbi:MAG TPA: WYL domain-containing protein [Ilumatobacteraceae bacterium]|jgi:predicted DNA-binding transcriptional regulator YafY|nr:WYL domain-containing protein [Ilumatobacteraceae bacterium]
MVDQLERTTNLLALLLETRSPLTLEDIVNQLSNQYPAGHAAMRGAFERDKSLLRDVGVPIETEVLGGTRAGQTAYRVDRDRYELRDLDLTDAERRALQVAVAAARTTEAEFGMFKLGGVADSSASITANLPQLELLPALREAIAARASVDFRYHSADRTLQPYALLLREGFWYVMGHDEGHDEVRTYRVDRIEGTVTRGEGDEFERPADFDPRAVFPADPKELGDGDQVAIVRIDQARATFAERELGPESVVRRLPGGDVEVEVPCANLDAFRSWLFGWGVHAEVVGPADVRDGLIEWLRAMASRS